jgi:hypothetical protein
LLLLTMLIAATAFWSSGWGKNSGHMFGDPLLAREMIYAGQYFVENGFSTFGLPVYVPGGRPYTHLTPGPEWIQALIAWVRPARVPPFLWHSAATALLSIALLWMKGSLVKLLEALGAVSMSRSSATWAAVLLVGTTPAFIIYSGHAYCAATFLGNAIALFAAASWASAPDAGRWHHALVSFVAAIAALRLGTAPGVRHDLDAGSSSELGEADARWRRAALSF